MQIKIFRTFSSVYLLNIIRINIFVFIQTECMIYFTKEMVIDLVGILDISIYTIL